MAEARRIRVLIAEDHTVVREGLCALIEARPEMEVVGQASDGVEAVLQVRALRPDVIVMDLVMPRKGGVEAIAEIKRDTRRFAKRQATWFRGENGTEWHDPRDPGLPDRLAARVREAGG